MSTRYSDACSRTPNPQVGLRLLATAASMLMLTATLAVAADEPKQSEVDQTTANQAPAGQASAAIDPITEVAQGDTLTQIRISAISFQNPEYLGQALAGVIGAFLKQNRPKDALVDLSIIRDPVWRAYALLHFAEYHYSRGEMSAVNTLMERIDALTGGLTARPEKVAVLGLASARQAKYGNFGGARKIASRIPSPFPRIAKLIEIAELQAANSSTQVAASAVDSLRLAFDDAKKATIGKKERLSLLLAIVESAISLRHPKFAQQILEFGYGILAATPDGGSTPEIAEFTAGMVRIGESGRAMDIVRAIKDDLQHSYVLASVARAFADTGSIEGAVPLFFLALQDTESLEEGPIKRRLLTHILLEQTRAARLADAFNTAGKITDKKAQRAALFEMARILLKNGKPLEALKLVDYLPDMGMRAQILTRAARHYYAGGDKKQAAVLMLKAVQRTGIGSSAENMAAGIPLIFENQVEMSKGSAREEVFAGARKLLELIPNTPIKVPVMTRIARAEMRDGQKDAADRSLGMAWRIAWFNKDKDIFPDLLTNIALAQLNIGELLLAFDTAARISDNPTADIDELQTKDDRHEVPKVKALTSIAVAAARRSEGQLALRAARTIADPAARAKAYREIALALPVTNQQATLGKGTSPIRPGAIQEGQNPTAAKRTTAPAKK